MRRSEMSFEAMLGRGAREPGHGPMYGTTRGTPRGLEYRCPDGHWTLALGRLARAVIDTLPGWEFADREAGPWRRCTEPVTAPSASTEEQALDDPIPDETAPDRDQPWDRVRGEQ